MKRRSAALALTLALLCALAACGADAAVAVSFRAAVRAAQPLAVRAGAAKPVARAGRVATGGGVAFTRPAALSFALS